MHNPCRLVVPIPIGGKFNRERYTEDVVKFLTNTFTKVGFMNHLRNDNGDQFRTDVGKFCIKAGIQCTALQIPNCNQMHLVSS